MARKTVPLETLKSMLVFAEARAVAEGPEGFIGRQRARDEVRKLKARIARRERDEMMRSLGLVKVRGNLGGTYWE